MLLEYTFSKSVLSPALAARVRLFEAIEQCLEDLNGHRITTFIAHEVSYNIEQHS